MTDALGSTVALADSTGTMQTQYTFDPFGSTAQTGNSTTNSLAYTGRETEGIGLCYYRARYYDPAVAGFVSEDQNGFKSGTNFYSYVHNNPLNFLGPMGLQDQVPGCAPDCVRSSEEQAAIQREYDAFMIQLEPPGVPLPSSDLPSSPDVPSMTGRNCGCNRGRSSEPGNDLDNLAAAFNA